MSVGSTGFFEILRNLFAEIYQVKKLLAFVLPIWSVNRFPFNNYTAFSLARAYRRSIEASKFWVNAIPITIQSCSCTVRILQFTSKINVQLRQGLSEEGSVVHNTSSTRSRRTCAKVTEYSQWRKIYSVQYIFHEVQKSTCEGKNVSSVSNDQ